MLGSEVAGSDEAREGAAAVRSLFARAAGDYMSVDLWLAFAEYVAREQGTYLNSAGDDGADAAATTVGHIRDVFEEAVGAVGWHPVDTRVWDAFLAYERTRLTAAMKSGDADAVATQKERMVGLWTRRMAVPVLTIQAVWDACTAWHAEVGLEPDAAMEELAAATTTASTALVAHEQTLANAQYDAAAYNAYTAADGLRPGTRRMIFERAVTEHCLSAELWRDYAQWMDANANPEAAVQVWARGTRNCPWYGDLWVGYLAGLASDAATDAETIDAVAGKALAALNRVDKFDGVAAAVLAFHRRRVSDWNDETQIAAWRQVFPDLRQAAADRFGKDAGKLGAAPHVLVARVESELVRDYDQARKAWGYTLRAAPDRSDLWWSWIAFESMVGSADQVRAVFAKALEAGVDKAAFAGAWRSFEAARGSVEEARRAEATIRPVIAAVEQAKAARKAKRTPIRG